MFMTVLLHSAEFSYYDFLWLILYQIIQYQLSSSCCQFFVLIFLSVWWYVSTILAMALCISLSVSATSQCSIKMAKWMELFFLAQELLSTYPILFQGNLGNFKNNGWLIDWVVLLRPTRHKIGHFRYISPSQFLGLVWKKTKPNTTKAHIHQLK